MDREFLDDIARFDHAQRQVDALAEQLKPWAAYREQVVAYIIAKHFREYGIGTHTVSLPDGRAVEFVKKENVSVNEDLLPVVFDEMVGLDRVEGMPVTDEQVRALSQLHKLVRWAPSLDKRQYDKLPDEAKKVFDRALTRTLAKPSFSVKGT